MLTNCYQTFQVIHKQIFRLTKANYLTYFSLEPSNIFFLIYFYVDEIIVHHDDHVEMTHHWLNHENFEVSPYKESRIFLFTTKVNSLKVP